MLLWTGPKATLIIANTVLIVIAQAIVVKPGNVVNGSALESRPKYLVLMLQTDPVEYSCVSITSTLGLAKGTGYLNSQILIRLVNCFSVN